MRRLMAGALASSVLMGALAGSVQAQPPRDQQRYSYHHHHRYACHREKNRAGGEGAVMGAVGGGLIGGSLGHGLAGGLLGAGAGALAGHAIARSTVHC